MPDGRRPHSAPRGPAARRTAALPGRQGPFIHARHAAAALGRVADQGAEGAAASMYHNVIHRRPPTRASPAPRAQAAVRHPHSDGRTPHAARSRPPAGPPGPPPLIRGRHAAARPACPHSDGRPPFAGVRTRTACGLCGVRTSGTPRSSNFLHVRRRGRRMSALGRPSGWPPPRMYHNVIPRPPAPSGRRTRRPPSGRRTGRSPHSDVRRRPHSADGSTPHAVRSRPPAGPPGPPYSGPTCGRRRAVRTSALGRPPHSTPRALAARRPFADLGRSLAPAPSGTPSGRTLMAARRRRPAVH